MAATYDADLVPAELRERRQWVLLASVPDGSGKKPRKLPKQANGQDAKTNDPSTWTTFAKALERYQRGGMAGIGYVFAVDDPYSGIDLDDCLTDAGTLKPWAAAILERIGPTYAEVSPSGNGVKLWVRATLPAGESGKKRTYHDGAIEVYAERRYFTVTADKLDDAPSTICDAQDAIDWIWLTIFAPAQPSGQRPDNSPHAFRVDADRQRVIDRARKYLAALPAAVSGQGGHDATFHAACALVLGFSLAEAEALELLAEYSARCDPPWTERELLHKVQSAAAQSGERGYLLREPQSPRRSSAAASGDPAGPLATPIIVRLADVEPRAVSWLWPERIALGKLTLLAGDPGLGKSFLSLDLAARVSTGAQWPDGSGTAPLGGTVLLSGEDELIDTVRPRLDAAGADVLRIDAIQGVNVYNTGAERCFDLARDLPALEMTIRANADCRLVVVDPITAFLGQTDSHKNAEVRALLKPLADLASKYRVAVLAVTHLNKASGVAAIYRAMGSLAFVAAARAAWCVTRDPDDPERRLFLPAKNNLGRDTGGLAFSVANGRVVWQAGTVDTPVDEALTPRERSRGPEAEALSEASTWLRAALAGGPRLAKELLDEWQSGQAGSKRTLDRAKQSLSVEAFRPRVPGPWWWRLPSDIANTAESKQLGNLGNLEETSGNLTVFDGGEPKDAKLPEPGNLGGERVRVTI